MVNISESGLVVTVISPVYNGAKMLPQLVRETLHYATQINPLVELILIDDHSPDNSWAVIEALCKQYPGKVRGIRLAQNVGQHTAILTGLTQARGLWVALIDCDLQDNPAYLPLLHQTAQNTASDWVWVSRQHRTVNKYRKLGGQIFYFLFAALTRTNQNPNLANFGWYSQKVIKDLIQQTTELPPGAKFNFRAALSLLQGYKSHILDLEQTPRMAGKTNYSVWGLWQLAWQMFAAYAGKALKVCLVICFILCFMALFVAVLMAVSSASITASWRIAILFFSVLSVFFLVLLRSLNKINKRDNFVHNRFEIATVCG